MFLVSAILVFLAFVLAGYAMAGWLHRRQEARRALARRLQTMAGTGAETLSAPLLRDQRLSSISLLNALLGRVPLVTPLVKMVRQAGLKRRVGEVLLYVPLLAVSALLLNALLGGSLAIGVVAAGIAGAIPLIVVWRIRRKRTLLFAEQLPEALDLIRSALQAGHGLPGAFTVVADTFADPISYEFRYVVEEMRLGLPMRDALYNLADRVDDQNLPILTVGILVAQDSGGNLAEVVDNVGYTIRERFKLKREVRVLTAQGRLSGTVLTALPFFVGIAMYLWNPSYFAPMLENSAGHYMIAYALLSLVCGHLIIRRIVQLRT